MSLVHPAAWALWSLSAGAVILSTNNPFYLLPVFAAAWVVQAVHRRQGPASHSFALLAVFGLITIITRTAFVLFAEVTAAAVLFHLLEGLRLAVLLAVFGAFNAVVDPFRILRLAPRRFHEPALAAALAVSIAPRTIASVAQIRESQRLRGMDVRRWRHWAALAVPVLETGMDDSISLAESMDARGHGRGRRSRYRPEHWGAPSTGVALAGVCAWAVFLVFQRIGGGELQVITDPVTWPGATAAVTAAVILFALPALLPNGDRR
jgi:energy-coupling factor transport system permease protein